MINTDDALRYSHGMTYIGLGAMPYITINHWKPCVLDILENYPTPMSDSWIKYFMSIATVVASKSKDRTKVGCVLVSPTNKQILSTGFNGFCRDVADTTERYADREVKMDYVVHAEANAICFAASSGMRTDGSYAFITLPPCHSCAKLLKQVGVTNIFYMEDRSLAPTQEIKDDWRKKQQLSLDILREAKINTYRCVWVNENHPDETQLIALKDLPLDTTYQNPLQGVPSNLKEDLVNAWDSLLVSLNNGKAPEGLLNRINQVGNYEQKVHIVRYLNATLIEKMFEVTRVVLKNFPKFTVSQFTGQVGLVTDYKVEKIQRHIKE